MTIKFMPARKVLLVDDDPLITTMISQILKNAGYRTIAVHSAQEAINLAQDFQPDLALLDVVMDGMSGMELAKYLHEETTVPFMFISANAEADIIKQATEHGAVGYLLKPFETAQILPAFEAALGRADEIRSLRSSEANLTIALNGSRDTSIAVGVLMSRFRSDRNTAFEILRNYARTRRCKISEIATTLLEAEEMMNEFNTLFSEIKLKQDA